MIIMSDNVIESILALLNPARAREGNKFGVKIKRFVMLRLPKNLQGRPFPMYLPNEHVA